MDETKTWWQRIIERVPGFHLDGIEPGIPGIVKVKIAIDESMRKEASDAAYEVLMMLDGKRVFRKQLDRTDIQPCYDSTQKIRSELDQAIQGVGPTSLLLPDLIEMRKWCITFIDTMEKYPQYLQEGSLSNASPDDILDFNTALGQMRGAIAHIARRLCDEYGHTLYQELSWVMTDSRG